MKSKINSLITNNKYVLISGGVALFIISIVYFCYSIIPFGDKIIYRMDLYHQYGPLFSELYDRITSGESLIYSWNTGLGSPFIGNFFNYLSSPLSIILLLFGHKNTFEAVAALIALKAIFSSMSLSYYLKKSKNANGPITVAFGIMYAFCAYFVAYYWNVMWIDTMYLLPLVALGIEKIINKGKCTTYIIFLSIAIFTNYYIGFMLCIFSCLYFLYYYFCSIDDISKKTDNLKKSTINYNKFERSFFIQSALRFGLSSISVGVILLFMLLPVAYILSSSSATSGNHPTEIKSYFTIFDFLANHLASLEPTIRSSGDTVYPNVYCGILTLMLIPIYMYSNKIRSTEKIATIVLLVVMYFSFNLNFLNFFWHGLHFPNDLPYRQSFMYSFILITLAYKGFVNINTSSKKQILSIGISIIAFIILTEKIGSANVDSSTVLISIFFVIVFTILLGLFESKKSQAYAISIIIVCSVISETIIANTDHYVANQSKTNYTEDYDSFKSLQIKVDENDDTLFYRVELSDSRARMDPSWYDYHGVSVFSSMAYESVSNLQKDIGLYGNNINSFTYNPQTPIYNSLFSIKYIYDRHNLISEGPYYSYTDNNATYTAYENEYFLNIGFPVSDKIINWDASLYDTPVDAQAELFKLATGIDNIYNKHYSYELSYDNVYEIGEHEKEIGNFTFYKINEADPATVTANITTPVQGHTYLYLYSRQLDSVSVTSSMISTTMNVLDGYILDLGNYDANDVITVDMPIKDENNYANVDFIIFTMDNEKFIEGYNKLLSGQIEYTHVTETNIEGKFAAEENEVLYTSIPYDKAWSVYVDGEKVDENDIFKISNALLGVKVTKGKHTINFRYNIPGTTIALFISLFFVILLIVIYYLNKNKLLIFKNKKSGIWEESEKEFNDIADENLIIDNEEIDEINENPIELSKEENVNKDL